MSADHNKNNEITIHKLGYVRLVDAMGDDSRIVQAARVSYGEGTRTVREDRGLIRYLLRNAHTSPFEQVVFTFHVKMPIFIARQWVRHRTARLNEVSARYSVMAEEFYDPDGSDINKQSKDNKQGRNNESFLSEELESIQSAIKDVHTHSYEVYTSLLDKGVAREVARITLPTSLYTEMYWQIDLHNLFHFLRLRMHSHAQREIRRYAHAIYTLIAPICPLACEAFDDYILHKVEFYKHEAIVLGELMKNATSSQVEAIIKKLDLPISKKEVLQLLHKLHNDVDED